MLTKQQGTLLALRLAMGWIFFYAGISKILNPAWTSAGYLNNAKTFTGFYQWLTQPHILPIIDFLNEWGLLLVGISLLVGGLFYLGTIAGILMMLLYYFPVLNFPIASNNYYLVDSHIIYIVVLLLLLNFRANHFWGIDPLLKKLVKK